MVSADSNGFGAEKDPTNSLRINASHGQILRKFFNNGHTRLEKLYRTLTDKLFREQYIYIILIYINIYIYIYM